MLDVAFHPEMKYKISHFNKLITYVKDRPGHDTRYAVDASKISKELSWKPKYKFDDGLIETINWYLANRKWVILYLTSSLIRFMFRITSYKRQTYLKQTL